MNFSYIFYSFTILSFMSLHQDTIDVTILGKHVDSVIKRTATEFVAHKNNSNNEYDSYGITEQSSFFEHRSIFIGLKLTQTV